MTRLLAALAALLLSTGLSAGPIQIVKDINRTVSRAGWAGGDPVRFGASWLVTLCTQQPSAGTCDPWISDGTPAGTRVLKHLSDTTYQVAGYTVLGSYAYFIEANNGATRLWRTDGSEAGTQVVADLGTFGSVPGDMRATNSLLFFRAGYDNALWRSDGTAAGTFSLGAPGVTTYAVATDRVYFNAADTAHGTELWATDGSIGGTHIVKDINPGTSGSNVQDLAFIAGTLYCWATDSDFAPAMLWASDGTDAGTRQVLDIAPPSHSPFVALGGKAMFLTNALVSGQYQTALWQSDGTTAGTVLIHQGPGSDHSQDIVSTGTFVFYAVNDSGWRSDGTAAGTVQIPAAGTYYQDGHVFVVNGDDVYFTSNATSGLKLMHASGSVASTPTVAASSIPGYLWGVIGSQVLIRGYASLWSFGGSTVAPFQVADGQPTNGSMCTTYNAVSGSTWYFVANDGVHGCQLWKTDGTTAGTALVKDLASAAGGATLESAPLTAAGGYVYFALTNYPGGLWRSDGTDAGTQVVVPNVYLLSQGSFGTSLYYTPNTTSAELWRVDAGASTPVKVFSSTAYTSLSWVASSSDGLYFWATTANSGRKLLKFTPATAAMTEAATFNSLGGGQGFAIGGTFVFMMWESTGFDVWRSDGTPSGTYKLASSAPNFNASLLGAVGDRVFYTLNNVLYRTDGTAAGTTPITSLVQAPWILSTDSQALWFVGSAVGVGAGLYRVGRIDAGAVRVSANADVQRILATTGGAVFLANDPAYGYELWSTTGGPPTLVEDFEPGTASNNFMLSVPQPVVLGNKVLMWNAHADSGWEIFSMPVPTMTPAVPTIGRVDFDGDGHADIVARRADGTFEVRLMDGTAVKAASGPLAGINGAPGHVIAATGDFNGDGKADLIFQRDDGATEIWLMNGITVLQATQVMGPGLGWSVAHVADFDGDGKSDLVWRNVNGAASLWLMNGTALLQRGALMTAGSSWTPTHVGDFNGDGRADIAWRGSDGTASVWLMNALTTVDRGPLVTGPVAGAVLQAADMDGDGKTDLLWQAGDGSVTYWKMDGRNIATRQVIMPANTNWTVTNTADFNGDGKADLVWLARDGTIGTWLMNGGTVLEKRTQFAAGSGWSCTVAQDMNADGKADIVWSNTSGAVGDWLMDGTSNISRAPLESAGSTNKVVPLQFHH